MRFRNLHKWRNLADIEGLLFFAQRAEELLFSFSLDTYKPSALNAPYLCEEAISVSRSVQSGVFNEANIKHVIEELRWSLAKDKVAKSLLDLPVDSYLPDPENEIRLAEELPKLEVLGRTLHPKRYLSRCIALLRSSIVAKKKGDIDSYARLFFTTLINRGYHKSHLFHTTISHFFMGDEEVISDISSFDGYVAKFPCNLHEYTFVFAASKLIEEVRDSVSAFNLEVIDNIPDELQQLATEKGFIPQEGETLVKVSKIRAFDRFTARERAEIHLEQVRDLFTLFHHKEQIWWRSETLAKQCCAEAPFLVALPVSTMHTTHDLKSAEASRHLNNLLNTLSLQKPDFRKFNRATDFHGLAIKNSDPENQLLSIWIALETIVPSQPSANKINRIVVGIIPFLTMNYLRKIFRALARDLIKWNRWVFSRIIKTVPAEPGTSLVKKLLLLVVVDGNQSLRDELYTELKDFHLLRYRIFYLSKSLANPSKVAEVLQNHESKVSWQIRRLYRTRNLIVHSGQTPHNIKTLIENGHAYLDELLMSIIRMSASEYKVFKIEQGFKLAEIAQKKIVAYCKGNEVHNADGVGVLIGEHDFIGRTADGDQSE